MVVVYTSPGWKHHQGLMAEIKRKNDRYEWILFSGNSRSHKKRKWSISHDHAPSLAAAKKQVTAAVKRAQKRVEYMDMMTEDEFY